jgi:hypothetical protein
MPPAFVDYSSRQYPHAYSRLQNRLPLRVAAAETFTSLLTRVTGPNMVKRVVLTRPHQGVFFTNFKYEQELGSSLLVTFVL